MMKIVLAPNAFKGSLSASAAAQAMKEGVVRAFPEAELVLAPVADGGDGMLEVIKDSLNGRLVPVTVTGPDGSVVTLDMVQTAPGLFETDFEGPEIGLYRLANGDQETVIGLGPAAPREFEATIASGDVLEERIASTRGGIVRIEDGVPRLRNVREGRPAAGRGWIGLTPRGAYETVDVRQSALLPPWLVLLLAAGFITAAWLREGRR